MAASYPGTVKTFTTKQPDGEILSAHINDLQDEVVAIETTLGADPGVWKTWTPTVTGWAAGYTCIARYCKVGKMCYLTVHIDGTSNNTKAKITLPAGIVAGGATSYLYYSMPFGYNNGVAFYAGHAFAQLRTNAAPTYPNEIWFWLDGSENGWAAASSRKLCQVSGIVYELL